MVTFGSHVGNHQFQPFLSGVYAGVIFFWFLEYCSASLTWQRNITIAPYCTIFGQLAFSFIYHHLSKYCWFSAPEGPYFFIPNEFDQWMLIFLLRHGVQPPTRMEFGWLSIPGIHRSLLKCATRLKRSFSRSSLGTQICLSGGIQWPSCHWIQLSGSGAKVSKVQNIHRSGCRGLWTDPGWRGEIRPFGSSWPSRCSS